MTSLHATVIRIQSLFLKSYSQSYIDIIVTRWLKWILRHILFSPQQIPWVLCHVNVKHLEGVHVLSCFSSKGEVRLQFDPKALPWIKDVMKMSSKSVTQQIWSWSRVFQHAGAPHHKACDVDLDLNPTGNLWSIFKKRVYQQKIVFNCV